MLMRARLVLFVLALCVAALVVVGIDKVKKLSDPLPGIVTDDKTGDITVNLTVPDSQFLFAVALTSVGVTPAAKSPAKNLTNSPPPGDGPYTLKIVSQSPTNGKF